MPALPDQALRVFALGGLGAIGRNMTVFEHRGKLLIVDCGVLFPDVDQPGVDLILPDFSSILDRLGDVQAIVLTHGHIDHIGGVGSIVHGSDHDIEVRIHDEDRHMLLDPLGTSGGFGAYLQVAHDWADPAAKWRSYELFARHVMPRFQGQAQPTLDAKARARAARTELAENNMKAVEMSTAKYEAELAAKQ